nr:trehalose-phosphatase [Spelaeicoccus albus]
MSPFVDDPQAAAPLPGSVQALRELAAIPGVFIGYISGRPVADLSRRVQPPDGAMFVGSHGAEIDLGAGKTAWIALDDAEAAELADLRADLARELAEVPGIRLEDKPAGVVVHFRQAADAHGGLAVDAARRVHVRHPRAKMTDGHQVVEFALRHASKGDGIAVLRDHVRPDALLFVGDDTTDEDGFAVLGPDDVSVKVGGGESLAQFRVGTPQDVESLLSDLLTLRREVDRCSVTGR